MQTEYTGKDNLSVMQEAKNYNEFLNKLISKNINSEELITDFGAGCGTFALPLYQKGYRVVCIETDTDLSSILTKSGLNVKNDIAELKDNSVDYIYSLNVIEHIEDDQLILNQMHTKIRSGGNVFIYAPAFQFLYSAMDKKVCHFRRYSKNGLISKLQTAGFFITSARYADSLGFFATLLYKMTSSGDGDINVRMLKLYDRWIFPMSELLDNIVGGVFGKNVWVRAQKP